MITLPDGFRAEAKLDPEGEWEEVQILGFLPLQHEELDEHNRHLWPDFWIVFCLPRRPEAGILRLPSARFKLRGG